MKLETFFEKFDQFADAPNAVAKMRELVLHLAVTGHLVPAAHDWQTKSLKSLATKVGSGATPSGGRESYFSEGIPLIRSMNVHFRGFVSTGLVFLSDEQADQLSNVIVQPNDVLLNITGASIGRVTTAPSQMAGARVNQHVMIIRPTSELLPTFLSMFLASPWVQRMINDIQVGATRQALTKGMIEQFEIPVPTLAEQNRIVAKVDELMALCDRLEAQQQERDTRHAALSRASLSRFAETPTPANLNLLFHPSYPILPADLRKSILTLAVQGKLVPQDPCDESADALLARLTSRDIQNNGRRRKSEPIQAFTPDEIPFELPSGWAWERLGNIGDTNIGLTYSPQDVSDVGIPVLRSSNVQNGKLDFEDLVRVKCEPKQSVMVQDGDLLICARNGSRALVGKVAVIECLKEPAAFGAFMAIFRSEVNQYLYHFIRSPLFRQMIDEVNTTTINQITQNNLRATLAPIPPLAEQRRIVAKVDQLMALVDQMEAQLADSRAAATELMEAVVHELLTAPREETAQKKAASSPLAQTKSAKRPIQHFARAVLSAEIVDFLHDEPTFGRIKHQKIFHLCEHIAQITDIDGHYHREAAGPLDNRLIYANEAELKKQQWYAEAKRDSYGHSYAPLAKAGNHRRYSEQFWPDKIETIRTLILLMRDWSTDRCEIFSTAYAAWNDLLIWGREETEEAILHEILDRWNPTKKRFKPERWLAAIQWMKKQGFTPTGFGHPTASPE